MLNRAPAVDPENPSGPAPRVVDPIFELWQGVLLRACADARQPARGHRRAEIDEARAWLADVQACGWLLLLLGIDLEYWAVRCVPMLQRRWQTADERPPRRKTPAQIARSVAGLKAYHVTRLLDAAAP